jgi:hypothetical protein
MRKHLGQLVWSVVLIATIVHQNNFISLHPLQSSRDATHGTEEPPVDSTSIPHAQSCTGALRFIGHAVTIAPVRRSIKSWHPPDHISDSSRSIAYFRSGDLRRHLPGMPMRHGVVADRMTGRSHCLRDGGKTKNRRTNHEKCSANLKALKDIQNLWSPSWIRAVVKCQINSAGAREDLLRFSHESALTISACPRSARACHASASNRAAR